MNSDEEGCAGCGCLLLIVVAIGGINKGVENYQAYQRRQGDIAAMVRLVPALERQLQKQSTSQGGPSSPEAPAPSSGAPGEYVFWPGEVLQSPNGYLTSDKFIPLRALARRPNVPMFQSEKMEYPQGVVGVMKTWHPYYIFARKDDVLLLGRSGRSSDKDRQWVKESDCFCWTTRECLNIEQSMAIYSSKEDARNGVNAIDDAYHYQYEDHFERMDPSEERSGEARAQVFRIAALPVLHRDESGLWCFVRPEGDERGYQVCWVQWDGDDPKVDCRIRASRLEFEQYVIGLRRLMTAWRNPEKKSDAKRGLYDHALASITRAETVGSDVGKIVARREGIPKLTGFLENPIESELQYETVTKRVIGMMRLSNSDAWDVNEVAYIKADDLP